ncbi:TlpA family protein disulfide reductase [Gemmata sp. G18]|uniref:TlpA family protein disulfide reductase n=1 Tax=Gemmata palustris TaxID=2822762 RepID=A0ABS5BP68_9BACT|nr:TlpA disulfide reductase family protein [Gemmata palustris]MBP3955100.1 TlpA family protein disulfide reductase [Gemmata palustris]
MRTLLLTLAVALIGGARLSAADEPKPADTQPTLKVGDAPPPLKATKWLAGSEVKAFESGKVYVVEFWATWCGPCVVMMPHLGDIQEELAGKVTVIGFTAKDASNTPERVSEFVKKRGNKLGYTIAYADDRETYDAYMKASGQNGIPCSFVIGKDGKIAYIGHPLFLDEVLPKVLAGTWDAAKGAPELEAADKLWDETYSALMKPGDPAAQLKQWEEFSAKWPRLAADPYMTSARLKLLVAAKRFAEAQKLAETVVTKAAKRNDVAALGTVADAVSADAAAGQADLAAVGVKAAESALAIDGETATALIRVIKAHAVAGNAAKVKELGPKAVTAAEKEVTGDKDAIGTLRVAAAHLAAGDKAKAKAAAEKAIGMVDAQNAGLKKYIEDQAKKYVGESK